MADGTRAAPTPDAGTTAREVIARRRAGYLADQMVHAPWQKSWETPSMRAWESHAIDVDEDLAALEAAGFVVVRRSDWPAAEGQTAEASSPSPPGEAGGRR